MSYHKTRHCDLTLYSFYDLSGVKFHVLRFPFHSNYFHSKFGHKYKLNNGGIKRVCKFTGDNKQKTKYRYKERNDIFPYTFWRYYRFRGNNWPTFVSIKPEFLFNYVCIYVYIFIIRQYYVSSFWYFDSLWSVYGVLVYVVLRFRHNPRFSLYFCFLFLPCIWFRLICFPFSNDR